MARHLHHTSVLFFALATCAVALVVVPACGPRAETKPVEAAPLVAPTAPLVAATVAPPPPAKALCDNDVVSDPFDCTMMPKLLGDCGAMAHYACPKNEHRPEGMSFRAGTANRMAQCFANANGGGKIDACVKPLEACVRSAVEASCARSEDVDRCARELPACDEEHRLTCAKLLSSMEPKLHEQALANLHQLNGKRLSKACRVTWDFAGFPFCPFCRFGE